MNLTYNNDDPSVNDDPSDSQGRMLTNTKSINSWNQIDHHGFGDPLGGYHTIIHQDTASPSQRTVDRTVTPNTFVGIPAAIASINQLFAADVITPSGTDTQLFTKTGNNGLSQITGNFASTEGYCWCSGILFQWGEVTGSAYTTPAAVIFANRANCIKFPNSCFTVVCTPLSVGTSTNNTIQILSKNDTQFTWQGTTGSLSYMGFNWIAIGN